MNASYTKKTVLLTSIGLIVLIILLIGIGLSKANAAEEPIKTVLTFLEQNEIQYSDVVLDNNELHIQLQSDGDRCTLKDIKAIQAIYEAVHAQSLEGGIKDVGIEIYGTDGRLIYDVFQKNVSVPIDGTELLLNQNESKELTITDDEIISSTESIVSNYSFKIKNIEIAAAKELTGKKIILNLAEINQDNNSLYIIQHIYKNLEDYALSTGAIAQCEIYVMSNAGGCLMYYAGDFQYRNCIGWISPIAEKAFIAQEGPR